MLLTLSFAITLSMKFAKPGINYSIGYAVVYAIGNAVGKAFAMPLVMPLDLTIIFKILSPSFLVFLF